MQRHRKQTYWCSKISLHVFSCWDDILVQIFKRIRHVLTMYWYIPYVILRSCCASSGPLTYSLKYIWGLVWMSSPNHSCWSVGFPVPVITGVSQLTRAEETMAVWLWHWLTTCTQPCGGVAHPCMGVNALVCHGIFSVPVLLTIVSPIVLLTQDAHDMSYRDSFILSKMKSKNVKSFNNWIYTYFKFLKCIKGT